MTATRLPCTTMCRLERALLLSIAGLGAAMTVNVATPARACSGPTCREGSYYLPAGATVPANAPALLWRAPRDRGQSDGPLDAKLHLERIDLREPAEVGLVLDEQSEGVFLVRLPEEGLEPGGRYRLSVEVEGTCVPDPLEFDAVEAAPLPEELGRAVVMEVGLGEVQLQTSTGSCYSPVPAVWGYAELELSEEAEPWADLLQIVPQVDGDAWLPSWSNGPIQPYEFESGETIVFAECMGKLWSGLEIDKGIYHQGQEQGAHTLTYEATLPGVDGVIVSDEARYDLDCNSNPDLNSDSGPEPDDGSCAAVTPGATDGRGGAMAVLIAGLLLQRRKRFSDCAARGASRR